MHNVRMLVLSISALLAAGSASAAGVTTITFESVPGADPLSTNNSVPDGYAGLNWNESSYVLHRDYLQNTGYEFGAIDNWTLYSAWATPLSFSSPTLAQNFDFKGAYIASAWTIAETVLVEGFDDGILKYSTTISVTNAEEDLPELFAFNFKGIDTVNFSGYSSHIVLDNLQLKVTSAVPEPGVALMALAGVAVAGVMRRRRAA